ADPQPGPDRHAAGRELLDQLLDRLDGPERELAQRRALGQGGDDIARDLGGAPQGHRIRLSPAVGPPAPGIGLAARPHRAGGGGERPPAGPPRAAGGPARPAGPAAPPAPPVALREDQARRWAAGECVPAEAYLPHSPAPPADDALVLVLAEVELRRGRGEEP